MDTASNLCARCGGEATKRCTGCIEGVDDEGNLSPIFYCTTECQKAHWQAHKATCYASNHRRQLFRGASLVQDIFYAFREHAYDGQPYKVVREHGKLYLHLKGNIIAPDVKPIYPFPGHLFNNEEDKKTVLSWLCCNDSLCWMHELLKKVLKGITNEPPTELCFDLPESINYICDISEAGQHEPTRYSHWVTKVCLKGGAQYVIDLSGAQYRQYKSVVPLSPYLEKYAKECPIEREFGSNERDVKSRWTPGPSKLQWAGYMRTTVHSQIIGDMNAFVNALEKHRGKSIAEMLNLKQKEFEHDKKWIMMNVVNELQESLKHLEGLYVEIRKDMRRLKAGEATGEEMLEEIAIEKAEAEAKQAAVMAF